MARLLKEMSDRRMAEAEKASTPKPKPKKKADKKEE